jgi:hypothetical protein
MPQKIEYSNQQPPQPPDFFWVQDLPQDWDDDEYLHEVADIIREGPSEIFRYPLTHLPLEEPTKAPSAFFIFR